MPPSGAGPGTMLRVSTIQSLTWAAARKREPRARPRRRPPRGHVGAASQTTDECECGCRHDEPEDDRRRRDPGQLACSRRERGALIPQVLGEPDAVDDQEDGVDHEQQPDDAAASRGLGAARQGRRLDRESPPWTSPHATAGRPALHSGGRPSAGGTPVPKNYVRLTQPLVRDSKDAPLRPASWDEALDQGRRGLPGGEGRPRARRPSASSRARRRPTRSTSRPRSSAGPCWAATTSTAATGPDTPRASPVWRPCSVPVAAQVHTVRPKRRT